MSGLSRKQKRTEARRLYDRFSKMWREDMRLVGLYGKKTPYKKPTFAQWSRMHERDTGMMEQSTPEDVIEHLGFELASGDPWAAQLDPQAKPPEEPERGVTTIQIVGDDEEA